MLIYSKLVDGSNVLYGTKENIPSTVDQPLVCKDESGVELDISSYKYFYSHSYNKSNYVVGGESTKQIPSTEDKVVSVYLADGTPVFVKLETISSPLDLVFEKVSLA